MNAKQAAKITKSTLKIKELKAKKDEEVRLKQQQEYEAKKPERIQSEYAHILKLINKEAKEGLSSLSYCGKQGNGVSNLEVLDMLRENGYEVKTETFSEEQIDSCVTPDGQGFRSTGIYYNKTVADISW